MIYQGDNWPAEYRNRVYTLNLHGLRINSDILVRQGSFEFAWWDRNVPRSQARADKNVGPTKKRPQREAPPA